MALTGSLYYGNATLRENARSDRTALVLAPSSQGRLDLLAGDSIYAGGYSISRSGASTGSLATPLNPSYQGYTGITRQVDNLSSDGSRADTNHFPLFAFGANSVSGEWGAALEPSRFYALAGDLVGVDSGRLLRYTGTSDVRFGQLRYEGHGAVRMIAYRDIVSSGTGLGSERTASDNMGVYASSGNLFVNTSATDVSLVQAGRDILYGNFNVAGPGSLEISAGRNLLMNDEVAVTSLGAVAAGDTRSGASIVLQAGASQADYSGFLRRYLELDNLAQAGTPLAEQPGKVVRTYENELIEWLSGRYGFSGDAQQAREFLAGLSAEQQRIFAREVYFAELKAGGREYNEVGGVRQGSYLRGRNAIAALFPERDPAGNPISYEGDIVMYGGAGVHTNFGGDIQLLTPGGQQVFGIEGEAPPSTAGVVTQGVGNIRSYALSSILLGQSRVMTTFGGDIQIWSVRGRHQRRARQQDHRGVHPAAAHLRRLGQRQPVAAGAQHRRRYRHPQPDSRSGAGRHRPDRPARHHRCRRGGHPGLRQRQRGGAAGGQRGEHPDPGPVQRHSAGGFGEYRCVDLRQRRGEFRDPGGGGRQSPAAGRRAAAHAVGDHGAGARVRQRAPGAFARRRQSFAGLQPGQRRAGARRRSPRRTGAQPIDR